MKRKIIILDSILTVFIIGASFAWMISEISRGEITSYERKLIINALDIDVSIYQYLNGEYVLITDPTIEIENMAPNDTLQFKIDITNNGNNTSTSKIVLSDIEGDIDVLKDKIKIGISSPRISEYKLSEKIETQSNNTNIFRLYDNFEVESEQTASLYWYISLDKSAGNEIASKELSIKNISILKP